MCTAIRFSKFEFTDKEILAKSLNVSGEEVRVAFQDKNAYLPVYYNGGNLLVAWGNKNQQNFLPQTGFCRQESLQAGKWRDFCPQPVIILASAGFSNGIWFQVRRGIKGILINAGSAKKCVYILTIPSTHYFKTMTGALRMPLLVGQII